MIRCMIYRIYTVYTVITVCQGFFIILMRGQQIRPTARHLWRIFLYTWPTPEEIRHLPCFLEGEMARTLKI